MQALFTFSASVYLLIYAFEGALRYGLDNVGMDSAILLRDGLLTVPLAVLLVTQAFRLRVHPAFFVFAGIIALHRTIATLNLHGTLPAIYGVKLLINVLFGFIVSRQLIQPTRRLAWLLAAVGDFGGRRPAGQVRLHVSLDGTGDQYRRHPGGRLAWLGHR